MRIEPLDAHDEAAMKAWHATFLASQEHERPHAVPMRLEEMRAKLVAERETERDLAFTGTVDGEVVAVGQCFLTLRDNLDQAWLEVNTRPAVRGRGHGSRMLDHLEAVARDHGRSVLVGEAAFPFEAPADGAGTPEADWVVRRGYTYGLGNVQRVLDLPADEALLRGLAEQAEAHHEGYTFRQFEGRVPDDVVDSFAAVLGILNGQAPSGEIEREDEVFDTARIRADEKVFAESGRTKFTTVALDPNGEVAAFSELVLPAYDPGKVFQWGTLARPQDRGRRLGLAVKVRNLLWAQPRLGAAALVTFNAEVNRHMIAVNERMAFRPVERVGEFQKRL